jgi:hypothetical protein
MVWSGGWQVIVVMYVPMCDVLGDSDCVGVTEADPGLAVAVSVAVNETERVIELDAVLLNETVGDALPEPDVEPEADAELVLDTVGLLDSEREPEGELDGMPETDADAVFVLVVEEVAVLVSELEAEPVAVLVLLALADMPEDIEGDSDAVDVGDASAVCVLVVE